MVVRGSLCSKHNHQDGWLERVGLVVVCREGGSSSVGIRVAALRDSEEGVVQLVDFKVEGL